MARRKDETIDDYEERVEEMEKMRNLELREAQAQGRKYRPGMSFAEMNAQDNAERRANLDSEDRWRYRKLGGMMSPTERARQRELMFGVSDRERFVADNTYRNSELKTREREAKWKAQGMKDQGSEAARYNAEASKYGADKTSETEKYRIDRQKEIEAARDQTNIKIAEEKNDAEIGKVTEQNKGLGTQGEWAVKLEQKRAKTEAAKAAAQEQVWKNRQEQRNDLQQSKEMNRRIDRMVSEMQKQRRYRGKSIEELVELAKERIAAIQNGNGE